MRVPTDLLSEDVENSQNLELLRLLSQRSFQAAQGEVSRVWFETEASEFEEEEKIATEKTNLPKLDVFTFETA